MFSPYIHFTTEAGLQGIKVRMYHPAIFIPNFIHWLKYWKGLLKRYRGYEKTLRGLYENNQHRAKILTKKGVIFLVEYKIQSVNCGYACDWSGKYGFVPEDGCSIHDV